MKVAITGGAGFIGTHLVKLLTNRGYEAVVIDNFTTNVTSKQRLEASGATVYNVDITDRERLKNILKDVEALVHLAALIDVRESEEKTIEYAKVNILGTISLLKASFQAGVQKLIFASSAAVYGKP